MGNQQDLVETGGAVQKQVQTAQETEVELKRLEQDLITAESDFRRAAVSGDFKAMVKAHNRVCQIVASMSAIWSGTGEPQVFVSHYQAPSSQPEDAPDRAHQLRDSKEIRSQPLASSGEQRPPELGRQTLSSLLATPSRMDESEEPKASPAGIEPGEPSGASAGGERQAETGKERPPPDSEKKLERPPQEPHESSSSGKDSPGPSSQTASGHEPGEAMRDTHQRMLAQALKDIGGAGGPAPAHGSPGKDSTETLKKTPGKEMVVQPEAAETPASRDSEERRKPHGARVLSEALKEISSSAAGEHQREDSSERTADWPSPSVRELEAQIAQLASRMQECLEIGDMDGMLHLSEQMGALSEMVSRKQASEVQSTKPAPDDRRGRTGETPLPSHGSWATGDTLALARQRAEERKKQTQHALDNFEQVVGEVRHEAGLSDPVPSSTSRAFDHKAGPHPLTCDELRQRLEQYTFYEILAIPSTASQEQLRVSFLKKIRRLNRRRQRNELEPWQFQEFVSALTLAYQILKNAEARLQYDLVLFGPGALVAEQARVQKLMPLKELLKFSTLVGPRDLSEASDAAEGKPEREMGFYLVSKGVISPEELDSILFGQKLVSQGKITVAQFELAMQEMRESSIPFFDTLVASEWIQPQDVFGF